MTMTGSRAAYFTGPGAVELRSDERPRPGPTQVLVRVRVCGICTMEQRLYNGVMDMYPVSPGHEPAGEIVEVGEDVVSVKPGDHVIISFLPRCMQCHFCRLGETDKCTTRPKSFNTKPWKFGGLSEFALAEGYQVFPIDPQVRWDHAAFGEPLACVLHNIKKANLRFGEDVLVIGGGTMGQIHVLLARLRGCRVILSEPDAEKLAMGTGHGAHLGVDPTREDLVAVARDLTAGRGVDAVFVTVGGPAGQDGLKAMRKGGRTLFYSSYYPKVEWPISPDWIHHDQVTLTGGVNQTFEDWVDAAALLSKGLVDLDHLVSGRFPLERIDEAMRLATNGRTFRVMVEMDG